MTSDVNIAPAGDHAFLIELDRDISAADLHAAARSVRAREGVLACIVGHSSLYVVFSEPSEPSEPSSVLGASVLGSIGEPRQPGNPATRTIRVSLRDEYAPELRDFLARTDMTRDEFLARIRALRLVVRYLGFRGGFAYLDGWPPEWAMPRRPTSRPVALGSFAIAGAVAGFYPLDSPGGWNVLGRTGEDLENRFVPGDEIAIEPVDELMVPAPRSAAQREPPAGIDAPFMTRVRAPDWSNLERGLPAGGPFDLDLAAAAGGEEQFEFAQVGPRITRPGTYTWADLGGVRVIEVREETHIGRITRGLRGYLSIGKAQIRGPRPEARGLIQTMCGPHDIGLAEIECEVTTAIDRVGIRMRPLTKIDVRPPADLPSIGMQFGTLQLHPDGSIVAMGPDHPVTGGYLQPMTVLWAERWKLAHLAPGERVRFVCTSQ